ncbi:hypothetical protein ACSNOI_04305 [Actinomadura kijaniata]|uniref:hypothetical protein n=1 Tax=Actinomadura kijaniata TaxID=46161 RepID=UPI003F1B96EC
MRVLTSLPAACVLAASLTACSSGSAPGSGGARPPASPAPLRTLSVAEVGDSVSRAFTTHKSVRVTGTSTDKGDPSQITAVISTANGTPEYDMTISGTEDGKPQRTQMLILRDGVYFRTDEPIEPGKPWAKAEANTRNPLARIFLVMGSALKSSMDPQQQRTLTDAGGTLAGARPEKVGGVDTVHYTINVDMEQALRRVDLRKIMKDTAGAAAQLPGLDARTAAKAESLANLSDAQLEKLRANMIKAGRSVTMTTELWLDAEGRPVKQATSTTGGKADRKVEMTYSDWGGASLTVPPADQVAPLPDLSKMPGAN